MSVDIRKQRKQAISKADEELLAELGYKQEFRRAFKPIEVFGIAFSIVGLLPSIASVLFYSLPNGGPAAMVWGVRFAPSLAQSPTTYSSASQVGRRQFLYPHRRHVDGRAGFGSSYIRRLVFLDALFLLPKVA
jgi:hypothetical protein